MRVLYLSPSAGLGGAERSLLDLLKRRPRSIDPYVILLESGPLQDEITRLGIPNEALSLPEGLRKQGESSRLWQFLLSGLSLARYFFKIRKRIRELKPIVIHSNGNKAHVFAAMTKPLSTKLIWHMRDFLSLRPKTRRVLSVLRRKADTIVCNSKSVEDDTHNLFPGMATKVLYNIVDPALFSDSTPIKFIRNYGLVATYAEWKGHLFLLEMIAQYKDYFRASKSNFYFIGGPIYHTVDSQLSTTHLNSEISRLDIVDLVELIPFKSDLREVYQDLDAVINASQRPEPFGRTIIEAMMAGRLVLAPDQAGPAELVKHKETGLLYTPSSVDNLFNAIKLSQDSSFPAQDIIQNAKRWALKNCNPEGMTNKLSSLYDSIGGN